VERALVLVAALLLDRWLGEPPNRWHPVVWMGNSIRWMARLAPPLSQPRTQLAFGLGMALLLPAGWAAIALAIDQVPVLRWIAGVLLLKTCFAIGALGRAGLAVAERLDADDLAGAREGLRSLCSRDPTTLQPAELAAGATESLAENASDSIVAPLFWYLLLGLPGVVAYRVVNTMDAMIGYHGRYEWLGKAAARLDDLLNLVPARLTALLILVGGWSTGDDVRGGWRVLRRDARRTESPNAGWPMAAMAGVLGVCLEKPGHYRLGDSSLVTGGPTIRRAWNVVRRGLTAGGLTIAASYAGWWFA
jgi:adenosylcobinamide-phosphate synthase